MDAKKIDAKLTAFKQEIIFAYRKAREECNAPSVENLNDNFASKVHNAIYSAYNLGERLGYEECKDDQ